MRTFRHWTPRYAVNRAAWAIYERRESEKPWLNATANVMLETLLLVTDVGLEWGSGQSTPWLASRIRHLTSIEHDTRWYETVTRRLSGERIANVNYRLVASPPEGSEARASEYVTIAASFPDLSLGLALVDGEAREYCAEAVIPKIAPGGVLVIDDSNGYLDIQASQAPLSRFGKGPRNEVWRDVWDHVSTWRRIWTSNGLKDTTIFIRPSRSDD